MPAEAKKAPLPNAPNRGKDTLSAARDAWEHETSPRKWAWHAMATLPNRGHGPRADALPATLDCEPAALATYARVLSLSVRSIHHEDGALRIEDSTLAGADFTLDRAVQLAGQILVADETALKMASLYPAPAVSGSRLELLGGNWSSAIGP